MWERVRLALRMMSICSSPLKAALPQLADPDMTTKALVELPQWPEIVIHLLWLYLTMKPAPLRITERLIGIGPRPESARRILNGGPLMAEKMSLTLHPAFHSWRSFLAIQTPRVS